jgi:hypothetical protein
LIRYIYKGACKLLSGQASSLIGPEHQSARSSHDPRHSSSGSARSHPRFFSCLLESKGPGLGNLVGLLGGLEGRVARVVLVLVACGRGKTMVSGLYGDARVVCVVQRCSLSSVAELAVVFPSNPPLPEFPRKSTTGAEVVHTGSKSIGKRVDAVCDDQACSQNRFSSPFSQNVIPILRALPRVSHSPPLSRLHRGISNL